MLVQVLHEDRETRSFEHVANVEAPEHLANDKRIKFLEERVRQLTEQVNRMAAVIELNGRQIRRQNTDIHNVNTVLRNR